MGGKWFLILTIIQNQLTLVGCHRELKCSDLSRRSSSPGSTAAKYLREGRIGVGGFAKAETTPAATATVSIASQVAATVRLRIVTESKASAGAGGGEDELRRGYSHGSSGGTSAF